MYVVHCRTQFYSILCISTVVISFVVIIYFIHDMLQDMHYLSQNLRSHSGCAVMMELGCLFGYCHGIYSPGQLCQLSVQLLWVSEKIHKQFPFSFNQLVSLQCLSSKTKLRDNFIQLIIKSSLTFFFES